MELNLDAPDGCSVLIGRPENGRETSTLCGLIDGLLKLFHYSRRGIHTSWVQTLEFMIVPWACCEAEAQDITSSPSLLNDLRAVFDTGLTILIP